jgi:hypothetical protein
MAMEAVELVVTALTAGAAAGLKDNATSAMKDAYATLLNVVRRRLAAQSSTGAAIVDEHATDPDSWREALMAALTVTEAAYDQDVLAAARDLLTCIDAEGVRVGKYTVAIRDGKGVQIGDGNTMNITLE